MRSHRTLATSGWIAAAWLAAALAPAAGQTVLPRITAQDAALDNLVDPPGYATAPLGTLGGVVRAGNGTQAMILVPGLGFGADVFAELMAGLADRYRMYAVTLPGFGGTAAPPSPGETTSFGEQIWTNSALAAVERLIADEGIEHPIVVGHWLTGTQIALRLAIRHPEAIRAVVLLAGAGRMHVADPRYAEMLATPEKRIASADAVAQRWFKTVTRETWDDNNFLPSDYAVHPVRGLRLWREAARPPLHVWVRYLCEFNAQDVTRDLGQLAVPTLVLQPGLEGVPHEPGRDYMHGFLYDSWGGTLEGHPHVRVRTVADSRALLWFDQPEAVRQELVAFLDGLPGGR